MKTCIDKTCEAVLCEECNDLKPSMCGDRGLQFPKDACDVITFEGVEDVETKQGLCVDLTEGVHAYDGDGTEISYTVEPSEIGCCDVGEHEVTYTAVGKGNKMLPSFCLGKPMLTIADCGLMTKVVTRLVTILQSLPPKIIGAIRTVIPVGATFDPLEGVSGIDDNGNETEVTYEGRYDETTGMVDIASFESDIDQNAKHLYVELEPIQDLHGYDKPWSGGAGKNKFDVDAWIALGRNNTYYSVSDSAVSVIADDIGGIGGRTIQLKPSTQYVISFTNASDCRIFSDTAVTLAQISGQTSVSFTTTDSGQIAVKFYGSTYPTVIGKVQIEEGSTATSWTPYENICPISGHTECVTEVCGKNLLDPSTKTEFNANTWRWHYSDGYVLKKDKTYNFSWGNKGNNSFNIYLYIADFETGANYNAGNNSVSYTPTEDIKVKFQAYYSGGIPTDAVFQLELGSTTSYEPYAGHTYTTTLGRTVYGGTLDVVSGELVVDRAMVDMGSLTYTYNASSLIGVPCFYATIPSIKAGSNKNLSSAFENKLDRTYINGSGQMAIGNTTNANYIVFRDDEFTDATAFKTAMDGVQLVYELAEPQTYQLTPQEVQLLLGTNNVWSEDGKVEVVYTKAINGVTQFDLEGVYTIYYHTEDECGNETTVKRYLIVGECNTEQAEPVLCKGKICCATLDCSANYLMVCNGTVCDGRVACSSSEPTICNGKICSARLSCTQTEITPIEAEE